MISIIVAYDENRGIGYQNDLPWNPISEDWKHFKATTQGQTVIMGKNTWESLPCKPLSDRVNMIISRKHSNKFVLSLDKNDKPVHVFLGNSLEDAIKQAPTGKDIFVIGGGYLYNYALKMNLVDQIIASEIFGIHQADTFFPKIDLDQWDYKLIDVFDKFQIMQYQKK